MTIFRIHSFFERRLYYGNRNFPEIYLLWNKTSAGMMTIIKNKPGFIENGLNQHQS